MFLLIFINNQTEKQMLLLGILIKEKLYTKIHYLSLFKIFKANKNNTLKK